MTSRRFPALPAFVCTLALVLLSGILACAQQKVVHGENGITLPPPPVTAKRPVTESIHGTTITDPYRWLEDDKSQETRAWIAEQTKYTEQYLQQVKVRPEIVKRLTELERVESYSIPVERGGKFFFSKRLPDENQPSIYVRNGLYAADQRLIDANSLSSDQNTSVQISAISQDGSILVYGIREGGADEAVIHFLDVSGKKELPDVLSLARYSGVSMRPDKQGVFYAKLEQGGTSVYYHRMGEAVAKDALVFGKEFQGEKLGAMQLISAQVTENGRYLIITVAHGVLRSEWTFTPRTCECRMRLSAALSTALTAALRR